MKIACLGIAVTSAIVGIGCAEKGSGAELVSRAGTEWAMEPSFGRLHAEIGRPFRNLQSQNRLDLGWPSYWRPRRWRSRIERRHPHRRRGDREPGSWSSGVSGSLETECAATYGLGMVGGNTGRSCDQHWTELKPGSTPFSASGTYCQSRPRGAGCLADSGRPRLHLHQLRPRAAGLRLATWLV